LLACRGVMVRQRKVRGTIPKSLAHRDAFHIQRVGNPTERGLRYFLVNVPALEMLDGSGVHDNQRGMDDRTGIHQRTRQRIAARLDYARKSATNCFERVSGGVFRKYAHWQPLGANRDSDFEWAVCAR